MLVCSKSAYFGALNQIQVRVDWGSRIEMLCNVIVESVHRAIAIAGEMQALKPAWHQTVSGCRSDAVARRLLLQDGYPMVSVA